MDSEGYAYCTGVLVPQGVLTAAHCVEEEFMVRVAFYHDLTPGLFWDRAYLVAVLRMDPEMDLALLQLRRGPTLPVGRVSPVVGEEILVVGHPAGYPYVAHWGQVSTPVRAWEHAPAEWYMVHIGLTGGYSGAPVLNRMGEVVGIVSWGGLIDVGVGVGIPEGDLGGIVPAEAIHAFLEAQ